jgi:hypothetical protein
MIRSSAANGVSSATSSADSFSAIKVRAIACA